MKFVSLHWILEAVANIQHCARSQVSKAAVRSLRLFGKSTTATGRQLHLDGTSSDQTIRRELSFQKAVFQTDMLNNMAGSVQFSESSYGGYAFSQRQGYSL